MFWFECRDPWLGANHPFRSAVHDAQARPPFVSGSPFQAPRDGCSKIQLVVLVEVVVRTRHDNPGDGPPVIFKHHERNALTGHRHFHANHCLPDRAAFARDRPQ